MKRRLLSITVSLTLISALFVGLDLSFDIIPNVSSGLIEVDDSGGKDYLTIQEGVDAAIPGDTVYVYAGVYNEDVVIDKTINLTGISRDNTTINASAIGILVQNVDYVNISGFTIVNGSSAGIRLMPSNNSIIENSRIELNNYGIQVLDSNNTILRNNIASNNSDYHGIYLDGSMNIIVKDNSCLNNTVHGIRVFDSRDNVIINNNCSNNSFGISVGTFSENNLILGNNITSNSNYGLGIFSNNNIFIENKIISNNIGVRTNALVGDTNILINCSITSSVTNDIYRGFADNLILLNTTFNKSNVYYQGTSSILYVQWYLHVKIIDYLGNPVTNAKVKIEDNKNGSYNEIFTTDGMGYVQWIPTTEYTEKDISGDNIGEKTFYTSHRIIAWNNTLVGYAYPEPFINESKTITIILYNGTLLDLEPGWNLISLPRIQLDTNLSNVLQSIEKQYDAVQWYNITDTDDHWKHYHFSKPPILNDLENIGHTMGLWVYVTDQDGTILVIIGDELTSNQNISLYPGWNLVGFPSNNDEARDIALGTLNFGSDVDSIWTYNATTQQWIELDNSGDYFKVGQGYWMHSKVEDVWNVPL